MEILLAALLLHTVGKDVNEDNIVPIPRAAGIDINRTQMKTIIATLDKINIENAINIPLSITSKAMPAQSSRAAPPTQFFDKNNKRKPPSSSGSSSPPAETMPSPTETSAVSPVCVICYQKYGNPYICLCQKDRNKVPTGPPERSESS